MSIFKESDYDDLAFLRSSRAAAAFSDNVASLTASYQQEVDKLIKMGVSERLENFIQDSFSDLSDEQVTIFCDSLSELAIKVVVEVREDISVGIANAENRIMAQAIRSPAINTSTLKLMAKVSLAAKENNE